MTEHGATVVYRDPLQILRLAKFTLGKRVGDNQLVVCPFHTGDLKPSCSVELGRGVFRCHGCSKGGRFEELIAQKLVGETTTAAVSGVRRMFKEYLEELTTKVIDPGLVEAFHRKLLNDEDEMAVAAISALVEMKGVKRDTLERFAIGWDGERYTLPVYDKHRNVVNVRYRVTPGSDNPQKCKNHPKHGTPARLYPFECVEKPDTEWVIVTEGELKALLLCQMGFNAVTGTAGAGKWLGEWNVWFKGKKVAILYDVDRGGQAGAQVVARNLLTTAAEVRVCKIPLDVESYPKGDVNDWYINFAVTPKDVMDLIRSTPLFSFTLAENGEQVDTTLPLNVLTSIEDVLNPIFHDKHVQVDAVIAAEETELYRVPIKWKINCQEDQPWCTDCPVSMLKKHDWALEPWCNTSLLKLIDVPEDVLTARLRKATGIPSTCYAHEIAPTELVNVQMVELIPDLDRKSRDRDTTVPAFFVQKTAEADQREIHGSLHTIKGFPTCDPKSGRLLLLAYEATPAKESLDRFTVSETLDAKLRVFQPDEWTTEGLQSRLNALYADFGSNVTHIFGREDMHLAFDLVYHSVLEIPFNDRLVKGWTECLVLGDSGQGKSVAFTHLRDHYGMGDFAVGASSTSAGLLGAVVESSRKKRWVYRWGKIPLNDRRLVCIEEASGLPYEIIRKLRDSRSSGRHEDTKAKLTRVSTRTRLIWIANPRSNRTLQEHPQGIMAMRELIGDDADIRRFDLAYFVLRGQVDAANIRNGAIKVPHVYTSELCQALILWAWSRKPAQIEYDRDAVAACRKGAFALAAKYSSRLPLVLDTEQDEKIARLATALAVRTYSTAEGDPNTVRVRACHVELVCGYLDRVYSDPACNYHVYSQLVFEEEAVAGNPVIEKAIKKLLTPRSTAEFLLEVPHFTSRDFTAVSGLSLPDAEKMIGLLLRLRAVRPNAKTPNTYIKTSGFITMLKRLLADKKLDDSDLEERYKDDKF